MSTELADRMRARADLDNLHAAHGLRVLADAFDDASIGFFAEPQQCDVKRFFGCWARARNMWCGYTGEPLI